MNISILNDTSKTSNWGCAATVAGLKTALTSTCPGSSLASMELQPLPYRKIKLLRARAINRLADCLEDSSHTTSTLVERLQKLNFNLADYSLPDRLILNGEGDIHSRSGHLLRLLGIARLFKESGVRVSAVNQSVDLVVGSRQANILNLVYSALDFVSVREPVSLRLLEQIGVTNARVVPDAAFSIAPATQAEKDAVRDKLKLPERYVCLTGSSDISKRSGDLFIKVYEGLKRAAGLPVIMMASTKTDKALARQLQAHDPSIIVMTDTYDYRSALAVIAESDMLVGGRFHPVIFAAREGTPVVPFKGNTHKMEGLMELLSYPVEPIDWRVLADCEARIQYVLNNHQALTQLLSANSERLSVEVARLAG